MSSPTEKGPLGRNVPAVGADAPVGPAFPPGEGMGVPTEAGRRTAGTGVATSDPGTGGRSELADLAGTAAEQGGEVVRETGRQARQLMATTREELREQATTQQARVAEGLWALSDELRSMASSAPDPGLASDLAEQAADRIGSVGSWLESHEPGQLADEVRRFAARRPGAFLAIAAGVGLLVGRATRSVAESAAESSRRDERAPGVIDLSDEPSGARAPDSAAGDVAEEWTASSVGAGTGGGMR